MKVLSKFCLFLPALLVLTAVSAGVSAQVASIGRHLSEEERKLPVDYTVFCSDSSGLARLEVYFQIFNHTLQFKKVGGQFVAGYEAAVLVKDKEGIVVKRDESSGEVKTAQEIRTTSGTDYRTKQANFDVQPGKYRVELTLRDRNTRKHLTRDFDIEVEIPRGKYPTLSGVELVQFAESGSTLSPSFGKGNMNLVPAVTGTVGGEESDRLLYYIEIYQGDKESDEVLTISLLRNSRGKMVYRDSLTVALTEWRVRQLRDVSLAEIPPGAYELEVTLLGNRNKKYDYEMKPFYVAWTAEALLRMNYEVALDQLEYIVSSSELDSLRELDDPEQRKQAFEAFWRDHDPSPGTVENELRTEFYRRISIANQRFTVFNRAGWRTDRGRIYIQYGEPDQIEDYPMALDGHPYQHWYYYRLGPYRVFTFVDEYEDGDYRLQFPYDGIY